MQPSHFATCPWYSICFKVIWGVAGGAPPLMMLGVDNSMHDKTSGDFTMCRLTLFAPYWVDNRCGLDLLFKDGPSAKGHPLLMGAHTYFDYAPVSAPGMTIAVYGVTLLAACTAYR